MTKEIKKLLQNIRPFKNYLIIIAFTGIVFGVTYSRLGLIVKALFDDLSAGKPRDVFDNFLIALACALVSAICRYFHIFLMNYVGEMVVQDLREKLQQKFMKLSLTYHSRYAAGSGGLISRVFNDVKVIQDGLRMVADFFLHPVLLICLLGNLFYLDYKLTFFTFLIVPIIAGFLRSISKSLMKYIPRGQTNLEFMTSIIKESLDGLRIIQSFNLEAYMAKRLKDEGGQYVQNRKIVHSRIEIMGPVTEFLAALLVLSILLYTSVQVANHESTPGAFIGFVTSLLMLNQPLKKIQESYVRLQEVVVATSRVYAILDEPSEVPCIPEPLPFPDNWKEIEFRNVSFAYGQAKVLYNVSFVLKRGKQLALVGPSGSGKSTIINLIQRFYDPTEGDILIDGIPINKLSLSSIRRHTALISQDVFLLDDTIEKNIQSGNFSSADQDVESAAKAANAAPFISRLEQGYKTRVGERGGHLSGGEKQRVSIARAFFKDAQIMLLDEATSALDSASEIEVQKGLDQLIRGRSAIIISHRLSTIEDCDQIIVMKEGHLIEQGSHTELLDKKGLYYKLRHAPELTHT